MSELFPAMEARGLAATRGGHKVLAVPHLALYPSTITAVCGPNGSGKSTLLRILALIDLPEQGSIRIGGRDLSTRGDWYQARRDVTMVAQHTYTMSGSVFANVAYGLKVRGVTGSEAARRVREALAATGLAGMERRRARTLSGGEAQRMAMARALVCDTPVLVLDEPTAHVDAARVREVEQVIARTSKDRGVAVVMATHDHDQASRMADRVFRMEDGGICEEASRIVEVSLERRSEGLEAADGGLNHSPDRASVVSLERSGDFVLVRMEGSPAVLRVSLANARDAEVAIGDSVSFK